MKLRIVVIAALGAALAIYLVAFVGIGAVLSAAVAAGWGGFAVLCLYTLGLFVVLGMAWHALLPDNGHRPLTVIVSPTRCKQRVRLRSSREPTTA